LDLHGTRQHFSAALDGHLEHLKEFESSRKQGKNMAMLAGSADGLAFVAPLRHAGATERH